MGSENIKTKSKRKVPLVEIKNLKKRYRVSRKVTTSAIKGVSLDIYQGEFLAITGHSGSGKTSLLNILGLIDFPSEGKVLAEGKNIHAFCERGQVNFRLYTVGFVFQFMNLLDNFTAVENIMFQLRLQGKGKKEARKKAMKILAYLKLKNKADSYPNELSGGEQQRVAIGRALAKDSTLILADEPTAHLDFDNGQMIIDLFRAINRKFKKTVVLVTHEQEFASQADRNVMMKNGKIEKIINKNI